MAETSAHYPSVIELLTYSHYS